MIFTRPTYAGRLSIVPPAVNVLRLSELDRDWLGLDVPTLPDVPPVVPL